MERDYSLDSLVAVKQQNYREFASTLRMNDKASHDMKTVLGKRDTERDVKDMVSAMKTMIAEVNKQACTLSNNRHTSLSSLSSQQHVVSISSTSV